MFSRVSQGLGFGKPSKRLQRDSVPAVDSSGVSTAHMHRRRGTFFRIFDLFLLYVSPFAKVMQHASFVLPAVTSRQLLSLASATLAIRLNQLSRNMLSNWNGKCCVVTSCDVESACRFVGLLSAVEAMWTRRTSSQLPRGTSQLVFGQAQKAPRSAHSHTVITLFHRHYFDCLQHTGAQLLSASAQQQTPDYLLTEGCSHKQNYGTCC